MITLFGATGYTGALIATVLERQGLPYRLAGRSEEKLSNLSASLASRPAWIVADATLPVTLAPLFKDTRVLINCAGPFTDLGERVLSLAAVAGVHYLDTTNELGYVYRAQTFDALAKRGKSAIVPACAFEVAAADCAAACLSKPDSEPWDRADVIYHLTGKGASRGTRLSALRSLATSWLSYSDGIWKGEAPGKHRRWFTLLCGRKSVLAFPSSESVTIPSHLQLQRVDTWMTGSPLSTFFMPLLVPSFARLLRSWPGHSILWAASRVQNAPNTEIRANSPFEVMVTLTRPGVVRSASVTGSGAYEVTAEIAAYAARIMLQPEFDRSGILAPSQLFDPKQFFHALQPAGMALTIHPSRTAHD